MSQCLKVVTPLAPKTAANNPAAAAIAAQLNDQRRAVQAAAGVEQSPANPVPAPKLSVRSMGGGGPTAKPVPTPVPQATTGSQQGGGIVPTTGSRVPSGPQAKASVLNGPALASVKASAAPVGSNAAPVMVTETQVKTSAASTNASTITTGSAEEFLSGWASLWSEKNADTYFGLYAQDFWPTYGETKTRPATPVEQRRTSRMPSNIEAVKPAVGGWPQP